jgi:hypothetical protein
VQRLGEPGAAVHLQLAPAALLEVGDLADDVAAQNRAVTPVGVGQGVRRNVLAAVVQLGRGAVGRVGDLAPVGAHGLVGVPAEQDRLGPGEPALHDHAHVGVGERDQPPAAAEPPAGVLLGPARALHHPVERQERVRDQLHRILQHLPGSASGG